jgi:hypothetical protein
MHSPGAVGSLTHVAVSEATLMIWAAVRAPAAGAAAVGAAGAGSAEEAATTAAGGEGGGGGGATEVAADTGVVTISGAGVVVVLEDV